jgi:adenylate cyclase
MRIPFRHDLRLKPSILTSFLLLTLPVFATIVAVTYISNERIAREDARELVERFRIDGIENVQSIFDPVKSLVRSAATLGDEQPDFFYSNRSIKYFLQHPAAQREDGERLCRAGRRRLPPGPPHRSQHRGRRQATA